MSSNRVASIDLLRRITMAIMALDKARDFFHRSILGLDDVTTYPVITKALLDKGYSKRDITKILGGNFFESIKSQRKSIKKVFIFFIL